MADRKEKRRVVSSWNKLDEVEGMVEPDAGEEALMNCLKTPSPSINWAFAQPGFGLPFGAGALWYGPPKGGKSVLVSATIGQLHADDPTAKAIKLDSELRSKFQLSATNMRKFGIDPKRFKARDTNVPSEIFDFIEYDVAALCEAGENIKLVIIDSLSGIQGRRTLDADTVDTQQRGDHALTIKDGLMRILPVIRRHNIALLCTTHVRAEQDTQEAKKSGSVKMQAGWATKHIFEYFCYIERNEWKDGKMSLLNEEFNDPAVKDLMDNAQRTGHKMRFKVEDSSFPYAGRTAEFTLNYDDGIINQYEEVFQLALNHGVIQKPSAAYYKIGDETYHGAVKALTAIRDNPELQEKLLRDVKMIDFKRIKGIKDSE